MKKLLPIFLIVINITTFAGISRLKDIIRVKGVRDNPIIGYGIVIGLNGTGDGGGEIVDKSLKRMFQKLGLNPQREISSKNVASVIVTAKHPAFARVGQKVDVTVSSIGNAKSLAGGTLLVTPLKGGDSNIYGIASGNISIGGLNQGQKFPTTGRIIGGATIEKELNYDFDKKKFIRLSLNNPDFTTSARVQKIINQELGGKFAISKDSATIDLVIPVNYQHKVVQLMAILENFKVNTDTAAKIIINERTGTIVAGGNITLNPVAISHGDLTIEIQGNAQGNKPNSLYYVEKRTTLNDLVKSLNAFGATPEDLVSIFQALKQNGSLVGEIELI